MPHDALIAQRLAALQQQYLNQLPIGFARIESAWNVAIQSPHSPLLWAALMQDVHRLAGNAGVFGLAEIGRIAYALQAVLEALEESTAPLPPLLAQAEAHMDALRELVEASGHASKSCLLDD